MHPGKIRTGITAQHCKQKICGSRHASRFQLDPGTGSMTSSSAPDFHLMRLKLYGGDFPRAILKEAENLNLPSFEGQKSAEPPTSQ